MKLEKYFNNSEDLTNFLNYAYKKRVRQLHVSNEYSSYKLLIKSLKKIKGKKFTFIIKLSEPKKDHINFNLKRFNIKFKKYRNDLGKNHNLIIQFVNRYKCNNPDKYIAYQQKIFDTVKSTVIKLKKKKIIKSFYFFLYHKNNSKLKKNNFIDGITCYRNIHNKIFDKYAKQNNLKIIAIRIFGGNKKIIRKNNLKNLISFNLDNKLIKKVIVGVNNKDQLDQLLEKC